MSYYLGDAFRGDYGRGSFYKGDPGLLSFVSKAARGLAGVVTHGASERLLTSLPIFRATKPPPPGGLRTLMSGPGTLTPNVDGMSVAAAVPGQQLIGQPRHRALHWNKETYVTRGGGTSRWPQQLLVHPKQTEPVPSRRMNVGNARALRHALHRVSGFAHLARRVMHFVKPGSGRGRFKFGKKRKRA